MAPSTTSPAGRSTGARYREGAFLRNLLGLVAPFSGIIHVYFFLRGVPSQAVPPKLPIAGISLFVQYSAMLHRGYSSIGAVSGLREGWYYCRDAHLQGTTVGAFCRARAGPLSLLLRLLRPDKGPTAISSWSGGSIFLIGGALVVRLDGRW